LLGDRLTSQSAGAALYAPLAVAFSPSGRWLALSGADPTVEVFDSRTGRQVRRLSIAGLPGGSYADSLAFSPDGRLLAAGAATDAYVWRLPSYEREPAFQHRPAGQG